MLTKKQKIGIDRLKEQESNVSEIAKQQNLDWKTVKRYLS
jgi:predicted transcriptional regulator